MKKSVMAVILSASLVLSGVSAASAVEVKDKAAVHACIDAAKVAKKAADSSTNATFGAAVTAAAGDVSAIKVAKKAHKVAKSANLKAFTKAIKVCKPKPKK